MRRLIVGLLILGLFGVGTAWAETESLPFKGSFSFNVPPVELDPTEECLIHHQSFPNGTATHLGAFTGSGTTCGFNPRVVVDPPFDPGGNPPYLVANFVREDEVWTAANGDQLYMNQSGVLVMSLADGTSGARGSITISGGTGRFEGATGELSARRDGNEQPVSFEGSIDYDASSVSS